MQLTFLLYLNEVKVFDGVTGTVTSPHPTRLRNRVSIPEKSKNFFLIQNIPTGSSLQKTFNSVDNGAPFPEINWPGREPDRVPSSNADIHAYSYRQSSISIWLFGVHGDNFTLPLPYHCCKELRSDFLHCLELLLTFRYCRFKPAF